MNILNKLGTALTVVFAVCLVALVVQIIYVLWRRRRFQQRSLALVGGGDVEINSDAYYSPPSKELLYFFCWKSQMTRIEPDAALTGAATAPPLPPPHAEAELDEELKWQHLYENSRVLFTIKEEEREGMEAEIDQMLSSTENEVKITSKEEEQSVVCKVKVTSEDEEQSVVVCNGVTVAAVVVEIDEATPFSTPCASPPYYTPSPSPPRDKNLSLSLGVQDGVVFEGEVAESKPREARGVSDEKTVPSVSIAVNIS